MVKRQKLQFLSSVALTTATGYSSDVPYIPVDLLLAHYSTTVGCGASEDLVLQIQCQPGDKRDKQSDNQELTNVTSVPGGAVTGVGQNTSHEVIFRIFIKNAKCQKSDDYPNFLETVVNNSKPILS